MKKIYTLSLLIVLVTSASAQILIRNENWPNVNWTVSGAYTPAALIFNPTVNDKFKYDTSLVSPTGGSSLFYISSPFFSLQPAFNGGEKALKIDFSLSFQTFANYVLFIQYWNADTSTWVTSDGADIQIIGGFSTCANLPVTSLLDFTSFTSNQLQNFRYRFGINDAGNQLTGVCINSPVVSSFMVMPPSNLNVININTTSVTLDWVGNNGFGTNTSYDIQYGLQGFTLGTGTTYQNNTPPYTISGLLPGTNYAFYVRENLHDNGTLYSSWAGPRLFTTATLGSAEFVLNDLKIYPNPTKNSVWIDSEKDINEIKVYNISGQELMKLDPQKSHFGIDLSDLNSGLYVIKASKDNGCGSYKIIKN